MTTPVLAAIGASETATLAGYSEIPSCGTRILPGEGPARASLCLGGGVSTSLARARVGSAWGGRGQRGIAAREGGRAGGGEGNVDPRPPGLPAGVRARLPTPGAVARPPPPQSVRSAGGSLGRGVSRAGPPHARARARERRLESIGTRGATPPESGAESGYLGETTHDSQSEGSSGRVCACWMRGCRGFGGQVELGGAAGVALALVAIEFEEVAQLVYELAGVALG
jgi:hypothetical protein